MKFSKISNSIKTDIEETNLFGYSTNIYNRSVIALENNSSQLAIQYGTDREWTFFVMNYEIKFFLKDIS